MSKPTSREEALFVDALACPAEQRLSFLATMCADEPGLRARISALLAAHASPDSLNPPLVTRSALDSPLERPGDRIGRYKLIKEIGEGGCGVVYLAEQEEPVRRPVALKVIKAGMDTREVIARFSAERQALALMDHPGIAKVLDAGATDAGRPYFVMELVRGHRITEFCDEHRLSIAARLRLFVQVCDAVHHAHQKGIIHRDLKPSNILVAGEGAAAAPKVIDFGIAKAVQGRLADVTVMTAVEQLIGTPAYMAPEQTSARGHDVDTRSDVYSLGVLLYELLVGRPPFDPKKLAESSHEEIRRIIREAEPPRPSTHLSTLSESDRAGVAARRSLDPAKLQQTLSGDLDWIVMKALEKNRERRYGSAAAFADEVTRHLRHEPVLARPPSSGYRVRKFVRRNRLLVTATTMVGVTLLASALVSTAHAVRARRAERIADADRHTAVQERQRATDERTRAVALLRFMLVELTAQLKSLGKLELLEKVGDETLSYFTSVPSEDINRDMRTLHVTALGVKGQARLDQTRLTEADEAFAEAYHRANILVAEKPTDVEALFILAQAEWGSGFVRYKRGHFDHAREWFVRYRDTSQTLAALQPDNRRWQREFASGQRNLAALDFDRGQMESAREAFLAELDTRRRLLEAAPRDVELRSQIADITSFLGFIAERSGNLREAIRHFEQRVAQSEALMLEDSETAHARFKLADALSALARVQSITGQLGAAQDTLGRARDLLQRLVAFDAANRRWRTALAIAELTEARVLKSAKDEARAATLTEASRQTFERLAADEPSDRRLQAALMAALRFEAEILAQGDATRAATTIARALEIGEKLFREKRATRVDTTELAQSAITAGLIARTTAGASAADGHWQRASELLGEIEDSVRDWRVLDAAARVALLRQRDDEATALLLKLEQIAYVPLERWPLPARLPAVRHTQP